MVILCRSCSTNKHLEAIIVWICKQYLNTDFAERIDLRSLKGRCHILVQADLYCCMTVARKKSSQHCFWKRGMFFSISPSKNCNSVKQVYFYSKFKSEGPILQPLPPREPIDYLKPITWQQHIHREQPSTIFPLIL